MTGQRQAIEALELAQQALNDWTATYAPDECGEEAVRQSEERISEHGTLCYIADVSRVIRVARAALQSVPDGLPTPTMVEAGLLALSEFNEDYESREDFVMRLFDAMRDAAALQSVPAMTDSARRALIERLRYNAEQARKCVPTDYYIHEMADATFSELASVCEEAAAALQSVPDGGEESWREALESIQWRSADKDNMAFAATITCYQMDAIRKLLAAHPLREALHVGTEAIEAGAKVLYQIRFPGADVDAYFEWYHNGKHNPDSYVHKSEAVKALGDARAILFAALAAPPPGADTCPICGVTFKADDNCLGDIEFGVVHAACCGPERESYCLDTGEPLGPGDPLPVPFKYASSPKPVTLDLTPLDFNGPHDAWANLEGVIANIEHNKNHRCDPVSLQTLYRVAGQLAALASPSGGK